MKLELELGDDAEVAAATAERPEQVGVLVLVGADDLTPGGDHLGADEVVARKPEATAQVADPAAERQAADAGLGNDARGGGETVLLAGGVELAELRTSLDARRFRLRIDAGRVHQRQVDHQSVVADRLAGDAVPATADRHRQALGAGEIDAGDHVVGVFAAGDHRWSPIDHAVPDLTHLVVVGVVGQHDAAGQGVSKGVDRGWIRHGKAPG